MGHRDWRGWEPPPERLFEKGDFKYVVLHLLDEKPRHGYDIIRALEDRMRGRYRPSPGSVYPTLQMLEDMGHIRSQEGGERKVYELTDAGRELAGALRLLAQWGARRSEHGEALQHDACGTSLEARWYCPTCDRVVSEDEAADLHYV